MKSDNGREIGKKLIEKTKQSTQNFKEEFKKQSVTAITAAFGFLIALNWREPITELFNLILIDLGLKENSISSKFFSAIVVTFLAVIFLIILSKWTANKK